MLNNTACIVTELIVKNEIVVDGREMYDKIMNEKTIDLLFSQIDAEVNLCHSRQNSYHLH